MIPRMHALGWHLVKVEAALPSVRRLGFSKVWHFARHQHAAGFLVPRDHSLASA